MILSMSRSYKKTPYVGQKQDRRDKRRANKAVRKDWQVGDGGDFKRVSCSYDIRDFGFPVFKGDRIDGDLRELYKYVGK